MAPVTYSEHLRLPQAVCHQLDALRMQPVDMHNHSWTNYVQAAYKGVFEYLHTHEPAKMPQKLKGLNLVIEGQVPQGEAYSIAFPLSNIVS